MQILGSDLLPIFLKNVEINDGFDLLVILHKHYNVGDNYSWWWPSFFSLRVENGIEVEGARQINHDLSLCFAAILGQNTKYTNAANALSNLYNFFYNTIEKPSDNLSLYKHYPQPHLTLISQPKYQDSILQQLANQTQQSIIPLIKTAGFHQQKASRIITLAQNIIQDFGTFSEFATNVTKGWLLKQKGIGQESASSILNYALKREEMVVDNYTQRLLWHCGMLFDDYYCMQNFLMTNLEKAQTLYDSMSLAQIMARFHGKIVELNKQYRLGRISQ